MPERTIFVADMHLRPGEQPEQNRMLTRFIERVLQLGATRLIFLGDTFNFWFERGGRVTGDYHTVLNSFAQLTRAGVRLDLVSGNRDFMFGAGFDDGAAYPGFFRCRPAANQRSRLVDAGINPRGFNCRFVQDGELIHCTHGDMYSLRAGGHGMMRWWTMALGPRMMLAWAPFFILNMVFGHLQMRDTLPYRKLLPTTPLLEADTFISMVAEGVRHVFCGHFHTGYRCLEIPHPDRPAAFLHILPCWLNGGTFASFSAGRLELLHNE